MATSARVTSVQALVDFKAKLCAFGVDANNALAGIDLQIRRAFEWLEEQLKHWQREVRRRQEFVVRAKNDLLQRQSSRDRGHGPGTTEQELALEEARARLREAEMRVDNCKHWARILPREVMECEAPTRQLAGLLESDLPQAVALLEQKILSLEAYLALLAPAGPGTGTGVRGGPQPPDDAPARPKET